MSIAEREQLAVAFQQYKAKATPAEVYTKRNGIITLLTAIVLMLLGISLGAGAVVWYELGAEATIAQQRAIEQGGD